MQPGAPADRPRGGKLHRLTTGGFAPNGRSLRHYILGRHPGAPLLREHTTPAAATGARSPARRTPFGWRLGTFALIARLVLGTGLWLAWPYPPAVAAARYSVDQSMAGFQPAALDIPAGEAVTVRLTNVDSPFHGITNGALHQFAFDEIRLDIRLDARQSQVITVPPMATGIYTFYCGICCGGKANKTMRGTLRVH